MKCNLLTTATTVDEESQWLVHLKKGPYKALKGPYKALKGPYKTL